jgi:heme/copper-type cytochrome/quinol oxidase subunit 1
MRLVGERTLIISLCINGLLVFVAIAERDTGPLRVAWLGLIIAILGVLLLPAAWIVEGFAKDTD